MERNGITAVGVLGHRAKSPARMLGAMGFANLRQSLENGMNSGNMEQVRDIISQLRPQLGLIKEKMDNDLK